MGKHQLDERVILYYRALPFGATKHGAEIMNDAITAYFKAKDAVHHLFGYQSDWVEIPMEDERSKHWMLIGTEEDGHVVWSPEPLTVESCKAGRNIYSGPLYTQRFLKKWVYRTPTHVMISVDTRTDGNKFLMIFDASLECKDDQIKKAYSEEWGNG